MIGQTLQIPAGIEWGILPGSGERTYPFAHEGGWVLADRCGRVLATAHRALGELHLALGADLDTDDHYDAITTLLDETTASTR